MTELYFPYMLHSVYCFFLWSTSLLSFSTNSAFPFSPPRLSYFHLYTRLGSHFPILSPPYTSILFCHWILCPANIAPFCYLPPRPFFCVALLPGNTAIPETQISPSMQIPPSLIGQVHQTRSAAPHLCELPLHMQGAFGVICVVCSDQRFLMYDLRHLSVYLAWTIQPLHSSLSVTLFHVNGGWNILSRGTPLPLCMFPTGLSRSPNTHPSH